MKLRTIFEIQAIIDERKIPCDIEEFLETERWCKSKEQKMTYGEMDITHYIRSVAKDNTIADRYQKEDDRYQKDRIEEMQYTLNQMCEDLETLKKDNE
jgi:hypothetical protein